MRYREIMLLLVAVLVLSSCTVETTNDEINFNQGVRLSVVHTGDIHSRLLPYDMDVMTTDERLGLLQANAPFGGFARAATVINRIRSHAQHSIHVDTGDVFQGAPIFNEFHGEPEILMFNQVGIDAFIIGNHEFDEGPLNLFDKLSKANFAVLAANYQWRPTQGQQMEPLNKAAKPYLIANADGVKVGVIGMANFSSLSSITYGDSGLGITVLENVEIVQAYLDLLKKDVNVLTMVTHLGLGQDEDIIRKTTGLDIVFGGHLHIVLNPPKNIPDASVDLAGNSAPRMVPLVHSGAFMKYVGHFDGVFYPSEEDSHDLELRSHDYKIIPIDARLPEDPVIAHLLAPYELELAKRLDLKHYIGYAPQTIKRFGVGGNDSPLGNFLVDLMVLRPRVEADFGATNSLGIRTDIMKGPITNDTMYNVFPFPNAIATLTLSGREVWALLDYNTYRSMNRGCQSQLQVSGVRYKLDCDSARKEVDSWLAKGRLFEFQYRDPEIHFAKDIKIVRGACDEDKDCEHSESGISKCTVLHDTEHGEKKVCLENLQEDWFYKFSTNDYMARGGSGFSTLKYNTTQRNTGVELREAAIDGILQQPKCITKCQADMGERFDPERPGLCPKIIGCKMDMIEKLKRECKTYEKYSERDICLDSLGGNASNCIGLSKNSKYKGCIETVYPECTSLYYKAKIDSCITEKEAAGGKCKKGEEELLSPFDKCANKYEECKDMDQVSEYERCVEKVVEKAEILCMEISCFDAGTDGRQVPIRPRNEVFEGTYGIDGKAQPLLNDNGFAIMEALQEAGYDACY